VTNLNDSGEGSLRAALTASGPRIITFAVSGVVIVDSTIRVTNGDFTLAGQTAPEGGITVSGVSRVLEFVGADNFIVRYLRVRPEYSTFDAISLIDCSNHIFDHISVSWGGDEVMTTRGDTDDVTFQRVLLAEGKTGTLFGDSNDPSLSENLSFHHNAYYNVTHRHPNVHTYGRADVYNNVVFNWKFRWSVVIGDVQLNHIGNYYLQGCVETPNGNNSFNKVFYRADYEPEIHSAANLVMPSHLTDPAEDNWRLWNWRVDVTSGPYAGASANTQLTDDYQVDAAFPLLGPPTSVQSATEAFGDVSDDVGANRRIDENGAVVAEVDALDTLYLSNIRDGACVSYMSSSAGQNFNTTPHYLAFIAGRSATPMGTGPADTNEDGIPDAWITARGFTVSEDLSSHEWPSGYIGVEEFLNEVDR
jgi:pectate lyase